MILLNIVILEGGRSVDAMKTVFDRRTAAARDRISQKSEYRSQNSECVATFLLDSEF